MSEQTQNDSTLAWRPTADVHSPSIPKIGHGLIILIDLMEAFFYQRKSSLLALSLHHKIPLTELVCAARKLEELGLIGPMPEDADLLHLQKEPQNMHWIIEITAILKKSFR